MSFIFIRCQVYPFVTEGFYICFYSTEGIFCFFVLRNPINIKYVNSVFSCYSFIQLSSIALYHWCMCVGYASGDGCYGVKLRSGIKFLRHKTVCGMCNYVFPIHEQAVSVNTCSPISLCLFITWKKLLSACV